jgi:hypothetical protein
MTIPPTMPPPIAAIAPAERPDEPEDPEPFDATGSGLGLGGMVMTGEVVTDGDVGVDVVPGTGVLRSLAAESLKRFGR